MDSTQTFIQPTIRRNTMRPKTLFAPAIAAAAVALAFSTVTFAADNDGPTDTVTTWTFQPALDSSDAGWHRGLLPWVEAVEEATEGTVKIRVEPVGSLTSGSEAFGAASAGMTDGYAGWATVYGGEMPERPEERRLGKERTSGWSENGGGENRKQ